MAAEGIDFTPDDLAAAGAVDIGPDPGYRYPADPRTRQALKRWQSLKFGVIMHWGLYALIGQGGSWSLCREGKGSFMDPPAEWSGPDAEYPSWYQSLRHRFAGEDYDPAAWARACAAAGMRYLVFTTKHHDGFAMYDTQFSNFKITAADVPMGRDVVRETFDAFRAHGLETGVYFSKADWAHPGYWDAGRPISDRFHNFDIGEQPRKWESFVEFTHAQIDELLTRYGDICVLWLDAGWVRAPVEPIRVDDIAAHARELQPDILVVDREVHGANENYRTPEQQIPDEVLSHPWESCMTMTRSWCSLAVDDPAKPTAEIIANLVTIVSRGGNYLLGIGPDATGALSKSVERGLAEVGAWMDTNSVAIYDTVPAEGAVSCSPLPGVTWRYLKTSTALYCIGLRADQTPLSPGAVTVRSDAEFASACLLGTGELPLTRTDHGTILQLPEIDMPYAFSIALSIERTEDAR